MFWQKNVDLTACYFQHQGQISFSWVIFKNFCKRRGRVGNPEPFRSFCTKAKLFQRGKIPQHSILKSTLSGERLKKRIFYGQADRKGWPPPPLTVSCFVIFSEGCIWLLFMIIHELKQILTKKMFFDPLYDPLVEWRWALQIVANTTTEPRMQLWEVH